MRKVLWNILLFFKMCVTLFYGWGDFAVYLNAWKRENADFGGCNFFLWEHFQSALSGMYICKPQGRGATLHLLQGFFNTSFLLKRGKDPKPPVIEYKLLRQALGLFDFLINACRCQCWTLACGTRHNLKGCDCSLPPLGWGPAGCWIIHGHAVCAFALYLTL